MEKRRRDGEKPSGRLIDLWSDQESRSFPEGWEFFESEVCVRIRNGKDVLSKAVVSGFQGRGVEKSCRQYLQRLKSLQD